MTRGQNLISDLFVVLIVVFEIKELMKIMGYWWKNVGNVDCLKKKQLFDKEIQELKSQILHARRYDIPLYFKYSIYI